MRTCFQFSVHMLYTSVLFWVNLALGCISWIKQEFVLVVLDNIEVTITWNFIILKSFRALTDHNQSRNSEVVTDSSLDISQLKMTSNERFSVFELLQQLFDHERDVRQWVWDIDIEEDPDYEASSNDNETLSVDLLLSLHHEQTHYLTKMEGCQRLLVGKRV